MEWRHHEFLASDDATLIDIRAIHEFLCKESYWAKGRSLESVAQSIKGSFCIGLYRDRKQIGFTRAVTDLTTFAYLCDVYILAEFQRKTLGHFLMSCVFEHPKLKSVKWLLKTTYAQSLYRDFGFEELPSLAGWMTKKP